MCRKTHLRHFSRRSASAQTCSKPWAGYGSIVSACLFQPRLVETACGINRSLFDLFFYYPTVVLNCLVPASPCIGGSFHHLWLRFSLDDHVEKLTTLPDYSSFFLQGFSPSLLSGNQCILTNSLGKMCYVLLSFSGVKSCISCLADNSRHSCGLMCP